MSNQIKLLNVCSRVIMQNINTS